MRKCLINAIALSLRPSTLWCEPQIKFYCRFDLLSDEQLRAVDRVKPAIPPFVVKEQEVKALLRKQNSRTAAGPDHVSL